MLSKLNIRNFAIIEDLEIEFDKGCTCLLGETGAGKSIIVDSINLLMGKRSSLDKIRNGKDKAFIEGIFLIQDEDKYYDLKDEYPDLIEEREIIVSRTIDRNNNSSTKVNYHNVPLSVLRDIMTNLIEIHSQHKDNSFFDETCQIEFLDKYILSKSAKYIESLTLYNIKLLERNRIISKLDELNNNKLSKDDVEYIKYQINEIEKAHLEDNEIEKVEDELKILSKMEVLLGHYQDFKNSFEEASNLLYDSKKALNNINFDSFNELIEKFNDSYYALDASANEIFNKFDSLDKSMERIEYLNERRLVFAPLKRKYGKTTEEILSSLEEFKNKLDEYENLDQVIDSLNKDLKALEKELDEIGKVIHEYRETYGMDLESALNKEIRSLALENASFKVEITSVDKYLKKGKDEVRFKLQANVGSSFLSLKNTASLGESSRLNLAYKLVFNSLNPVETIIFDEIDTGISSLVATIVAKKLYELSSSCQEIIITHLPQVAAISDHQYFVSKYVENGETKTQIKVLNKDEFVNIIASMMSADKITDSSIKASEELINNIKTK